MREEEKIFQRYGRQTGFEVPEGYFEAFRAEVASKLPEYPVERKAPQMSTWQKIRPYVYLAAMFAGIWCMMKVFHTMSSVPEISLEQMPANAALAMAETPGYDYYLETSDQTTDADLMDELSLQYDSIDEFASDFGYEIDPKFATLAAN